MSEETFGERLIKLRNIKGMKREHLALKAGVTIKYLKNIEENTPVSPEIIERLASALDTTAEYLKNGGNQIKNQNLQNFEQYVREKGINTEEAQSLRMKIEIISTRASKPLSTLDFDDLSKQQHSGTVVSDQCYRCGRNYKGSRCDCCGSFGDQPD